MDLSIIIPTFGRPEALRACLDAIAVQAADGFEVIVVDDGSVPPITVPSLPSLRVRTLRIANLGPGRARNFGARAAAGEVLLFLDDDCWLWPDAIARCREIFRDERIGVVGADIHGSPSDNPIEKTKNARSRMAPTDASLVAVRFIPGCAYAIRTAIFRDVGGFDETFLVHEDDDLWHRLLARGVQLYRSPRIRVTHRVRFDGVRSVYRKAASWSLEDDDNLSIRHGRLDPQRSIDTFANNSRIELARTRSKRKLALLPRFALASGLQISRNAVRNLSSRGRPEGVSRAAFLGFNLAWDCGEFAPYFERHLRLGLRALLRDASPFYEAFVFNHHALFKNGPAVLVLFVTNRCQADCDHCFYFEHLNTSKTDLSLEEYDAVSRRCGDLFKIYLSGGEPFLRSDLVELAQIFYRRNALQRLSIPTNGYKTRTILDTTREICRRCPNLEVSVNVSIDGMPESHDRIRRYEHGFEAAARTIEELCQLQTAVPNLRAGISTTLMPANRDEYRTMLEYLRARFPEANLMADVAYRRMEDGLSANRCEPLTTEDAWRAGVRSWIGGAMPSKTLPAIQRFFGSLRAIKDEALIELYAEVERTNAQPVRCRAPDLFAVIRENGNTAFCEQRPNVGSIRDDDLETIWKGERAQDERRAVREGACACSHCIFQDASIAVEPWRPETLRLFGRAARRLLRGRNYPEGQEPTGQSSETSPEIAPGRSGRRKRLAVAPSR